LIYCKRGIGGYCIGKPLIPLSKCGEIREIENEILIADDIFWKWSFNWVSMLGASVGKSLDSAYEI
jgi:hypothetical protein